MNAKYGGIYSGGVIPAKTYPGQDKDNKIAVVQNILVSNASDDRQGRLRHRQDAVREEGRLALVHGEAKAIALDTQNKKNTTIPWHPGAAKYFTEKGAKM